MIEYEVMPHGDMLFLAIAASYMTLYVELLIEPAGFLKDLPGHGPCMV